MVLFNSKLESKQTYLSICYIVKSMTAYTCDRCGYETSHKKDFKQHLSRKTACKCLHEQSPSIEEVKQIYKNLFERSGKFHCDGCDKMFASYHSRYVHKKNYCNNKVKKVAALEKQKSDLEEQQLTLQNRIMKQDGTIDTLRKEIETLRTDMLFLKDKKNEEFYQRALETLKFHGCTHQRLRCGITDITTDTLHAEIKVFDGWKEAVGQLLTYNQEMPRNQLHVYLFGKYSKSCKQKAVEALTNLNIQPFEIQAVGQGVRITNLLTETEEFLSFDDVVPLETVTTF